jgi:DNA-binding LytR/AlgR family response regulator
MSDSLAALITISRGIELDPSTIIRFQGDNNYTRIITAHKTYIASFTLRKVMNRVGTNRYLRVHKGHCVNPAHVQSVLLKKRMLVMSNGDQVPVSRRSLMNTIEQLQPYKVPIQL